MPKTIVIVGAGFVGLRAAQIIATQLKGETNLIVIDPKDNFLFSPRLIDALALKDDIHPHETAPLKPLLERLGARLIRGYVEHIDREQRHITYKLSDQSHVQAYDLLVLCPGSETNFYHIPGAAEYARPLKQIEDVHTIHEIVKHYEGRKFDIIVVGGGAAGVEAVFSLQHIAPQASFSLVYSSPQILDGFPSHMIKDALKELTLHNIKLLGGQAVTNVTATGLTTNQQIQEMPADLIVWCAGIKPRSIDMTPQSAKDPAGCLIVDHDLRVQDNIFAGGDVVRYSERNLTIPKNAQTAMLMGESIGKNIVRLINGQPLRRFHYQSKGNLLTLGNTGIIEFHGLCLKTRFSKNIRDLFYRWRFLQLTK